MHLLFTLLIAIAALNTSSLADEARTLPEVYVKKLNGQSVNIQTYGQNGKVTILNFWATWCTPCKRELDAITELYPEWQEEYNAEVVAITIDNARAFAKVGPMVNQKGWPFEILSDVNQELQQALNFQAVPQTFVVDTNGEIVYEHTGYKPGDEYNLEDLLKKLAGK